MIKLPLLATVFVGLVLAWLVAAGAVFLRFSVFSYGFVPLAAEEVKQLQWRDTWDFIIHKP